MEPGWLLSQPATVTTPSKLSAKMTFSMESAMTSRETREPLMPSVPIAIPSDTTMVPNAKGVPSAARTPSLTSSTRGAMCALHGVTSLCVEAMPTNGARMSSSVRPMARICERAAARYAPSVVCQLRCLPGARLASRLVTKSGTEGMCGWSFQVWMRAMQPEGRAGGGRATETDASYY